MGTIYTPTVGVVYKFTFQSGYDAQNGTYRLVKLMEYDEYLNDGGDLLTDFYEPNGKTETELNADLATIRESKIMKLVDPDTTESDPEAVYAPLCFLLSSPDYNVKRYVKMGVLANIGVTENAEDYDFMLDRITEAVEATLGITPDPRLVVIGHQWLTEDEYADIVAERDQTKISTTNYYSECIRLQQQVQSLQTINNKYEELIKNLQSQIDANSTTSQSDTES